MTNEELQAVIDLETVRSIRQCLERLDASPNMAVGGSIEDSEYTAVRRTARLWEQRLQASIQVRAPRADKGKARAAEGGLLG